MQAGHRRLGRPVPPWPGDGLRARDDPREIGGFAHLGLQPHVIAGGGNVAGPQQHLVHAGFAARDGMGEPARRKHRLRPGQPGNRKGPGAEHAGGEQ